ncbi:uncharacterized protein RAG0_09304 [Rhynchosporium agropyri]|uniref:Uncharacterized protein n=1 Tax=Rhynchosporium agropyri TaxID=914238 RepID=A0A1E1KUV3_9HELO|nr:uncharacterized protein RAG0_09304 [Rhynchosporium agropyri]
MFENVVPSSIEIAAPPAKVRAKFLDFESLPRYHKNGAFVFLGIKTPGQPLEKGAIMKNVLKGGTFHPFITFSWLGSVPGVFSGEHFFRFEESQVRKGETTFVHGERFSGFLGWMAGTGWVASILGSQEGIKKGVEEIDRFNRDLKMWVESAGGQEK